MNRRKPVTDDIVREFVVLKDKMPFGHKFGPVIPEEVRAAKRFLKLLRKAKSPYRDVTTYGLKHIMESYAQANGWPVSYVSEASFIIAANAEEFEVRFDRERTSAFLCVSKKSLREIAAEVNWTL